MSRPLKQMIYLHNTLGNKKEKFIPLVEGEVSMYNCGPTVYNYVHIGNLRSFLFADLLRRALEYNGLNVTQVMNITDIGHLRGDADEGEDKMTSALKREGMNLDLQSLRQIADKYTDAFIEDMDSLNILRPKFLPRASENIDEDIRLIEILDKKGFVYKTSDGLYFDTSKDEDYGKLGGVNKYPDNDEARIAINPEKRTPHDFALWKFDQELGWEAKWGKGFPGWHIECSAMSMKYLGENFDVHTGGIDHIPIHHNNEIAQSETATERPFANYWLHNAFININSQKISKSLGNDIYLNDIKERKIDPIAYRYYLLGAHYRTPMNFNWEALLGAEKALERLVLSIDTEEDGKVDQGYKDKFLKFINDDLDTPKSLALIWEIIQNKELSIGNKKATLLDFDRVLGLNLQQKIQDLKLNIPDKVSSLLESREEARKNKEWTKADEIRKQIMELGYEIKDEPGGPKLIKI